MNDEQKISQRYRELGREEPPRHLDDAILAAARRAAETRPAPLVVPTGRRRWYFPLAAAAVIVLAVAVTMHVEREQPDAEAPQAQVFNRVETPAEPAKKEEAAPEKRVPAGEAPKSGPPARAPKAAPPPPAPVFAPEPPPPSPPQAKQESQPAVAADQRLRDEDRLDAQRMAVERERLAQERAAEEGSRLRRQSTTAAAASRPQSEAVALAKLAQQSPEQWLLGIDDLKRQGKHEEAEKQLAEFRKRYPDYRIPQAITEKFERR